MTNQDPETTLVAVGDTLRAAIRNAIGLWAGATTSEGKRRNDLLRDKQNTVSAFFEHINKNPAEVKPGDVKDWLSALERLGIRPATIYQRACLLSSFYSWAMRDPQLGSYIHSNPARLARPKAPKAYQTESAKSLSDDELQALISVV